MARTDQPHKLSFDDFVAKVSDLSNPANVKHANLDYTRPETRAAWNGSKSKIPIWCNTCAEFFVQIAANHMTLGQGCPTCGKNLRTAKKTKADPIGDFRKVHGDTYDYSQVVYKNVHTKITIICRKHGPFEQKPNAHLTGHGCPQCWEDRRKDFGKARNAEFRETFASRSAEVHGGAYSVVQPPEHAHDTAVLNCSTHGDFEQKAFSHLAGHGCPSCGIHISYGQQALFDLVQSLGFSPEMDNRDVLGGLHIDVWVPEAGTGIEYHGSKWHTESSVGGKHRKKWERAEKAGVRLLQIFDYEWVERREACENRIRALFGGGESVGARQCDLREVPVSEATEFFKQVHTQGAGSRPKVAYGLFRDGAMLACMSFGAHRWSKDGGWELMRYASQGRVQGGFQRLLRAFIEAHKPEKITSYCDLRWGDGRTYEAAGFSLSHVTRPDYWYWAKERRIPREVLQRRPEGLTEKEWAAQQGFEKILGVGHQCWVWRAPTTQPASQAPDPVI